MCRPKYEQKKKKDKGPCKLAQRKKKLHETIMRKMSYERRRRHEAG